MNEDSILEKIRQWCEPTRLASTFVGIGDDAAVLTASGRPLVFASDLSIENVHFDLKFSNPRDVGYKSIARVLSDVAAMGAEPVAVTVSIALSKNMLEQQICEFLEAYFEGAAALARETKCAIAGGDLSRAETPIVIDVAAIGEIRPEAKPWLRSGAKASDGLFVSGELGGAAFALEQLRLGRGTALSKAQLQKHLRPRPRFDVADSLPQAIRSSVNAAIDISDGLVRDAYRLCLASGVSLSIDETALKLANGSSIKHALTGGDDYELLLAIPQPIEAKALESWARNGVYKLGAFTAPKVTQQSEVYLRHANGTQTLLASKDRSGSGHDPFRDI